MIEGGHGMGSDGGGEEREQLQLSPWTGTRQNMDCTVPEHGMDCARTWNGLRQNMDCTVPERALQRSAVSGGQQSTVKGQGSRVNGQGSMVKGQWSRVNGQGSNHTRDVHLQLCVTAKRLRPPLCFF
eukprot:2133097-Rhodomonas_salina.1